MRGLVKALAYCHHDLKLLHRDLKPQNVFLKDEDVSKGAIDESHIKLGDFGISKMLAASQGLAQTQCGTPLYMSPEMCRGEAYDRAADVWALGCIMYELMTFDAPWLRQMGPRGVAGVGALMQQISTDELHVDRRALRQLYSRELCALLMALLAPRAEQRPSLNSILNWPLFEEVGGRRQAQVTAWVIAIGGVINLL